MYLYIRVCVVKHNLKFLLNIRKINAGEDVFQEAMFAHVLLYKICFQCHARDVQQFFFLWVGAGDLQ